MFVFSGADRWKDPKHYPWTMGWTNTQLPASRRACMTTTSNLPDAKIAVLYQNDDLGKDYLVGLREGLGDKADKMMVATNSYETTDPTVDSQILSLRGEAVPTCF